MKSKQRKGKFSKKERGSQRKRNCRKGILSKTRAGEKSKKLTKRLSTGKKSQRNKS